MSQQLVKKGTNGKHENVMPRSWIEAIKDKNTGQTLVEILQGFNMYFLPYNGNTSSTRCLVPTMLRKKGLWITYVKYDGNVYTEWYAADKIDDKSWGDSSNWRVGNNTLVGDITISSNGNWVINDTETEFKAVGEKGNTPLIRVANNRLQVSYDLGDTYMNVTENPVYTQFRNHNNKIQVSTDLGATWADVSDEIAAYFRWQATTGDTQANNVGRVQISRDNKTWVNLSNDIVNNLHISRYIGVNESLPTSGIAEGTIYAKGPYYAEDDTLNDNPIYRMWVYAWKDNTLAWQDNGEFTSIAAGVVQETGDSETEVMSQKAVSERLSELGSKVAKIDAETIYTIDGYLNSNGVVINSSGYKSTDFLLVDKMCDLVIHGIELPSGVASLCFYDINKKRISEGLVMGESNIECKKEDIPSDAVFFRSSTKTDGLTKESYLSYTRVETILAQYNLVDIQKNKQMNKLFIKNDLFSVKGAYIDMGHTEQAISSYNATDYLAIDKSADIIINNIGGQSGSYAVNFYDKNKRPITDFDYDSYLMTEDVVTHYIPKESIPQNAVYIRSCVQLESLSDDTYIINANISSIFNIKNDIVHINSRLEKSEDDIKNFKGLESLLLTSEKSYENSILTNEGYISIDGITSGNFSDIYHTDYIEVSNGSSIVANLGVNGQIAAITLYKDNQGTLESVSRVINGGDANIVDLVEFSLETTSAEKYVRFSSSITKFGGITITKKGALDSILNLSDLFDYSKVLTMPRQVVRSMVETASNGRCTAIYDDNGMPSIMRKIPITSIGALSKELGDLNTPHPAFMVNGETKGCIYVSCFQTSIVNGVPVSWFGLVTDNGGNSYRGIKDKIRSKGEGWHLETIYERSLLSLLSVKHHNSTKPRGNTYYGRSHEEGFEYECVERVDGKLSGEETFAARWINGTQPLSWSHDNSNWGVFDLIGGFWEWCDLLKVVDGQIYIAEDNNYNSLESDWVATGAYIDVKSDGNIYFDNSRSRVGSTIVQKPWGSIVISDNYSKLSESLRKKLALLLVCPKVNATDEKPLFDFSGNLWIKTDSTYYPIVGGTEEYGGACGFGQIAVAYPETEEHGNMGSRMCYLPS